ncbi:MAG: hypothetical protein ACYS8W_00150 [Planctomycetota bacterium]
MLKPPEFEQSPKRTSFMSRKEMRYVFAMILVFLLMCFVIVDQLFLKKKPEEPESVSATVGENIPQFEGTETGRKTSDSGEPDLDDVPTGPPPPPTPFEEDVKIWDMVDDDAVNVIEDDPFYYALHQINSMNQSEITARAKADSITIEKLVENPAACRGKFITFQGGYIRELYSIAEKKDNRSGIKQFWIGTVYNARINRFFDVYFIDKQRAFDWNPHTGRKDVVKATGVFLKKYRFTNARDTVGSNYVIIARMLEEGEEAELESGWNSPLLWIAGAIVIILLPILFILMRIESRKASESEHAFKAKHRRKIDNQFARGQVKNPDAVKRGKDKPDRPTDS